MLPNNIRNMFDAFLSIATLLSVTVIAQDCCISSGLQMAQQYLPLDGNGNREDIIKSYFDLGFSYDDIISFTSKYNGFTIGLRQLKRILNNMGLWRKKHGSDFNLVIDAVEDEIKNGGRDLGYRSMHDIITKKDNLIATRKNIRIILKHIDPIGVRNRGQRRLCRRSYHSNGPNYLWHIDGWDKLKPFGLCVHGCIDGYSRKVMWLEASSTNNDPFVIYKYFCNTVKNVNGLPKIIRADKGTENVNIEIVQTILREDNADIAGRLQTAFLYGKSTANQRIECWWSKFGMYGMNTWIDHFKSMERVGIISTSSELDIECILFCYLGLLKMCLVSCLKMWNTHYIRKSRKEPTYGKPDVMYYMPELYGGSDCLMAYSSDDMEILEATLSNNIPHGQSNYQELFYLVMHENGKEMPNNLDEASDLLVFLIDTINHELAQPQ